MHGLRDGDHRISHADALAQYPVTPTDMVTQMEMAGAMYAPADWVTLMVMVPYLRKDMNFVTRTNVHFSTSSQGIGDIKLYGMFPIVREGHHSLQLNAGISFPTGSIDQKDATPVDPGATKNLPYPMQIGSGTYDFLPGASYTYQGSQWSLGVQGSGVIRPGHNHNGYALGNRFDATAWCDYEWNDNLSTSIRLDYQWWGDVRGSDSDLNPLLVPTADPNNIGGQRLDLLFGINLFAPRGTLAGNRLALEVGFPIYQNLHGPQLETDVIVTLGWQYTF
jgi:Putative MetA-pathway of phenol degradation